MKNVIITGANGNLGKAVTKTFLDKGYTVIATVSSEKSKTDLEVHDKLDVYTVDLTNEEHADAFVKQVLQKHGNVDAAVLLAGGFAGGNITKVAAKDVQAQIDLNFYTAFNVARPVFNNMMERGEGRIIFIGSKPALEAGAGKSSLAYGLSKSLLFKLADYLNAEAKGKNVTATVVAPGTLDTAPNRKSMPDADPDKWVKPADLAEILAFIVGDKGNPLRETVLKVYGNS